MNNGFTEEQLKKLKNLNRKYFLKTFASMLRCSSLLFLANFLVVLADILFVHSQFFVFICFFTGGFCCAKLYVENRDILADNLKAETLKILEDKTET